MSLFRAFPGGQSDFGSLFRLLDEYDTHRSGRGQSSVSSFSPRFDVRENANEYLLDGELPGVDQKDIDIQFSDPQTLVISGDSVRSYQTSSDEEDQSAEKGKAVEKKDTTEQQKPKYWVSERSVGKFHRTFTFPTYVDQDNVKANFRNGILSIVLPKAKPVGAKKITIGA